VESLNVTKLTSFQGFFQLQQLEVVQNMKKRRPPRQAYTPEDISEGIRLWKEDGYSKAAAASAINSAKKNVVPYNTLKDYIRREESSGELKMLAVGRPKVYFRHFRHKKL
jgi:hypothetical protein